jgi:long-chain acyl-CoA synthetase
VNQPWLKFYDDPVPPTVDFERVPLHVWLDQAAQKWPHQTAIKFMDFSMSYAELKGATEIAAENLRLMGVNKGDSIALMLPNLPQMIIAYWAVMRAGAVAVMTNPLYMETELLHQFTDANVRLIVTLDSIWPKVNAIWDEIPVEKAFIVKTPGTEMSFELVDGQIYNWDSLLKPNSGYTCDSVTADDLALLQYTGGTTGVSKGCMLTHYNLSSNLEQTELMFHVLNLGEEKFVGVLPYFHIYGLTVCMNLAVKMGATMLPMPRFAPQALLQMFDTERPTCLPSAPAIFNALLQQKDIEEHDLTSLKLCVSGSAPLPVKHLEEFEKLTGAIISEGYGLTEASPVTHFNPVIKKRKTGSIGLPMPSTDVKIVDIEDGKTEMPVGEAGELLIRGPQVMQGYFGMDEQTNVSLRDGWLYTGDICTMDEEGYFYVVDRKKDMIISSGFNVYPREIEEVLFKHPKIKEAVVIGVPSSTRGEAPKAFVVPKDGEELSRAEIISYCREKLASYKAPKEIEIREELPKSAVGKVLRRFLRDDNSK